MDAIAAFDLTKQYNHKLALQGINFQVPEGRAAACIGDEGSGKTTLVRLLAGLRRPTAGECSVMGLSPAFESARLHGIMGTVLHSARLYANMSIADNLRFFAGMQGVTRDETVERLSFLLHRLDIWDERDKHPKELPTGVLLRAGLARAVIHRPRVLVMDDQGAGMDMETAQRVRELLDYLVQEEGVTLLFCSQNMNYAQNICSSFALLHQGILLARGNFESLRIGGGVRLKAALRLAKGQAAPAGFRLEEGIWTREIQSEAEMPKLISGVVEQGLQLYEAKVMRPELEEIYRAYLAGGRRREESYLESPRTSSTQPNPSPQAG